VIIKAIDKYKVTCPGCGESYKDDGLIVHCEKCLQAGKKAILAYTPINQPQINKDKKYLQRYQDFLPGDNPYPELPNAIKTIKSEKFAGKYGLKNLYLTLTGYLPREDIYSPTCSFKELEAICVLHRLKSHSVKKTILLSSAGNTARAFAYYAALFEHPIIMVVPASSRSFLWLPHEEGLFEKVARFVRLLFIDFPSNYRDASKLAALIGKRYGDDLFMENGFFNIGRNAGLGVCALNFFDTLGRFPENYVQAVGSGTGALAVLRTYKLLDAVAVKGLSCHLVQNAPYTPLVDAIEQQVEGFSLPVYEKYIDTACSPMLTSADPAYEYPGGLRNFIQNGQLIHGYCVTNEEIFRTQYEFWKLENIQLLLPAAAAVAALIKDSNRPDLNKESLIQLNLTGCGDIARQEHNGYFYVPAYPACESSVPQSLCWEMTKFEEWIDTFGDRLVKCWD